MSKRLKNSPSSLAFKPTSVGKLVAQIEELPSQAQSQFLSLVTCSTTGKDQLAILKQIGNICKENGGLCKEADIFILTNMFMYCIARHPMRRSLSSMFQNAGEEHKHEVVSTMNKLFQSLVVFHENSSFDMIRENVDTIASLMENFPLGDIVIQENNGIVLLYLKESLEVFVSYTRNEGSPMDQTKMMQHTLTTLKTTVAVLQKCERIPLQESNVTTCEEHYTPSLGSILSLSLRVMCNEYVTLECRCAAAMVFPGVLYHIPNHFGTVFINMIYNGCKLRLPQPVKSSLLDNVGALTQTQIICEPCDYTDVTGISKVLLDCIRSFFDVEVEASSMLVLLHALLVKLPQDLLLQQLTINNNTSTLFNELFIDELTDITLQTSNKNMLVLAFRTITLWIEKARHILTICTSTDISFIETKADVKLLPHLVLYVDHYIDTIRHNVNTAIKDCFALLSSIYVDGFQKHVSKYFNGVLSSRGNIAMLINVCQFVSIRDILSKHQDLPVMLISILGDIDLASHACDLYSLMCEKHFKEICVENDVKEWANVWIEPMYLKLNDKNRDMKVNIVNFLIPSVLKIHPAIVHDILSDINVNPEIEKVRAVIVFLRCLRGMKNYVNTTGISFDPNLSICVDGNHKWKNMIRIIDMKKCLTHMDDQVRLDTLSLICNSVKKTDPVDKEDIMLLQYFLRFNMANENPSFRHQLLTNVKKFCVRLFNHAFQIAKQNNLSVDDHSHPRTVLNIYGEFLMWLTRFGFEYLYECAPYSQTSTSLGIISLVTEILDTNRDSRLLESCVFHDKEKVKFTLLLIQCFKDSYDPNRVIAIEIFKTFPIFCSFSDVDIHKIFTENIANLNSPKPDVSSVAAYYLTFLAVVLKGKDNRFLYDYCLAYDDKDWYFRDTGITSSAAVVLLDINLNLLKKQLQVAKLNLIRGCQDAPLYGVLYCMRLLFQLENKEFVELSSTNNTEGKTFASFLSDLIETSLEIIKIVSPYVSNDAPEGYLCDVSLLEVFTLLNLNVGEDSKCRNEVEAHVARMILVCCWRSMKEVSLLIGIIVSNYSNLTDNVSKNSSLTFLFIMSIWNMFCDILLRSKHAGAYELASLGFIKLSSVLWSSYSEELRLVPCNAVTLLVCDLLDPVPLDKAQVTRRSAGLPFYLEALCITEPLVRDKQSFKFLMQSLTDLCENRILKHDVNKIVISLNILRAFYKNAKLREDVFPFVSSGIIISINGFGSAIWAIRNSCTLMFSALMQRIFGVKKCKMTGREFFSRFPRLYTFLLDQVKSINETSESECRGVSYHPCLFPVLLLLSHLYPSTIEASNFLMRLDNFIPYVMKCGSNAVYKTRTMAAKALVLLVSLEQVEGLLMKIVSQIKFFSSANVKRIDENLIHGSLLQFQFLLARCFVLSNYFVNLISLFESFISMSSFCLDTGVSFVIKSLYIDTLTLFLQNGYSDAAYTGVPLSLECLSLSTINKSKFSSSPGHALFLRSAVHYLRALFKFTKEVDALEERVLEQINAILGDKLVDIYDILALLMSSNDHNVKLVTLDFIEDLLESGKEVTKVSDFLFIYVYTGAINEKYYAKALTTFGLLSKHDTNTRKYMSQIMHKLFENTNTSMNDETRTAVVTFSILFLIKQGASCDQEVSGDLDFLCKIWKFLDESCQPDQCCSCREETIPILSLRSRSVIFTSCPNAIYHYFNCCIKLLKDPNSCIRDSSVETLGPILCNSVCSTEVFVPQPSFLLDTLFKEKISAHLIQDPKQCTLYLISLMLDTDLFEMCDWLNNKDNSQCAEKPCDDSELLQRFVVYEDCKENPYYDLKEICELSCHVLKEFFITHEDMDFSFQSILSGVRSYYDNVVQRENDLGWTYVMQFWKHDEQRVNIL